MGKKIYMNRLNKIIIGSIVFSFIFIPMYLESVVSQNLFYNKIFANNYEISDEKFLGLQKSNAFYIGSDSELESFFFGNESMDGNSLDTAYLIENLIFEDVELIITSTTKYLTISNCIFISSDEAYENYYNTGFGYGLNINFCKNIKISNCEFKNVKHIEVTQSSYLNIEDCVFFECSINIYESNNSFFVNNQVIGQINVNRIRFDWIQNCLINGNQLTRSIFDLSYSNNNNITNNKVNGVAPVHANINILGGYDNLISNNSFHSIFEEFYWFIVSIIIPLILILVIRIRIQRKRILERIKLFNSSKKKEEFWIFISYIGNDIKKYRINELTANIENINKNGRVLYFREDIDEDIYEYIQIAINQSNLIMIFFSDKSIESEYIKISWMSAFKLNKSIISIYDDIEMVPVLLRRKNKIFFNKNKIEETTEKINKEIVKYLNTEVI